MPLICTFYYYYYYYYEVREKASKRSVNVSDEYNNMDWSENVVSHADAILLLHVPASVFSMLFVGSRPIRSDAMLSVHVVSM